MTSPSSSPYRVSWIDLTQPTVSFCITARAFATHGKRPTATASPYCSRASRLGEADGGDLRIGVDRARDGTVSTTASWPQRVLGRDLALAKRGVGELPVAGAVADRVDVRHLVRRWSSAAMPLRLSNSTPASSRPRPSTSGARPTATSIRSHSIVSPSPKWTVSAAAVLLDLRALLAELERDAALAERLGELLRGVLVLLRDQRRQHLDDRHLGCRSVLKIEANSQPMIPPPRIDEPRGTSVCASRPVESTQSSRVEARDRRADRERAGGDDRRLNVTSSPPSTANVFASLNGPCP